MIGRYNMFPTRGGVSSTGRGVENFKFSWDFVEGTGEIRVLTSRDDDEKKTPVDQPPLVVMTSQDSGNRRSMHILSESVNPRSKSLLSASWRS